MLLQSRREVYLNNCVVGGGERKIGIVYGACHPDRPGNTVASDVQPSRGARNIDTSNNVQIKTLIRYLTNVNKIYKTCFENFIRLQEFVYGYIFIQ